MAETQTIRVQRTVFDLNDFAEVLLVKETSYTPVESIEAALAAVGNDSAKLLAVVNDGLRAETRRQAASTPENWHTFDEEGEINGAFGGVMADVKKVNATVLTLAKNVFGYSKELDKAAKRAAKDAAINLIKGNQVIRDGLTKTAALGADEE